MTRMRSSDIVVAQNPTRQATASAVPNTHLNLGALAPEGCRRSPRGLASAIFFFLAFLVSRPLRAADAAPQLAFIGTWPHHVVIFDSASEKILGSIDLKTDAPRMLMLSPDKKTLYASTLNDNAIVSIELATRTVTSSFSLDSGNQIVRLYGLAIDPGGKLLYGIATYITKLADHYDVSSSRFIVIDLGAKKITRTADLPQDEGPFGFHNEIKLSPDGKLLYLFRNNILVFDTATLQVVKKVDLAKPQAPGIENVSLGILEDPNELPDKVTSVFTSSDPYVHREVFGIGTIDLTKLTFDFSPIGPVSASHMLSLYLTPDRKTGYTVAITGNPGNERCEFWAFDMATRKLIRKREFDGRTRFYFSISADGTKLFLYGAGFEIEIYDAKTFDFRNNVEAPGDMTTHMVMLPANATSASSPAADSLVPSR
jgi:WD40 repeat protein